MGLEQHVKDIFDNVNNWLKFAEAKNAAIIAYNSVILAGIASYITSNQNIPNLLGSFLIISSCLILISSLIGLISFAPQTKIINYTKKGEILDSDNLLYWGHLKNYTPLQLLKKLNTSKTSENNNDSEFTIIEIDYAQQIIMNSQIADKKYSLFKVALALNIFAITGILPGIFIWLIYTYIRKPEPTNQLDK